MCPYDYYDPFWAYGPRFIFASIFAPGPYFGLDYGYGPDYYYAGDYGYAGLPNIYYNSYQGGGAGSRARGAQLNSFDDLEKAAQSASDQLQSSCPTAVPQSPLARLDTIQARLSAMADAIKSVRPSLENFYASLSDEQKAKFNMMGPRPQSSSKAQTQGGGQQ